jgi:hypothetical protein
MSMKQPSAALSTTFTGPSAHLVQNRPDISTWEKDRIAAMTSQDATAYLCKREHITNYYGFTAKDLDDKLIDW